MPQTPVKLFAECGDADWVDDRVVNAKWVKDQVAAGGGGGGGGVPEAPTDGGVYARRGSDASWQPSFTNGSNGYFDGISVNTIGCSVFIQTPSLQGPGGKVSIDPNSMLVLSADPTDPLGAATKQYVDNAVAPSDRTLKENIAPLEGALDKVTQLEGVTFNFIGEERERIGLIAQDVEPILPQVIQPFQRDGEQKLGVDYPQLVAVLIEAVKTLTLRVQALEK
jgi:hypothetical protein